MLLFGHKVLPHRFAVCTAVLKQCCLVVVRVDVCLCLEVVRVLTTSTHHTYDMSWLSSQNSDAASNSDGSVRHQVVVHVAYTVQVVQWL